VLGFVLRGLLGLEKLRVFELHLGGDAAGHPVLDALDSALLREIKEFGDPSRAAKALDDFAIYMHGNVRPWYFRTLNTVFK
jgi:hypothetical protein